jgi:pyridoxamine 5'-phosphate oxidase
MQFQDCIKFANEHPTCYLATIDEKDWPRDRAMRMWFADEKGFHFSSHALKLLCNHLRKNNKAEACFYVPVPDGKLGTMLRVCGETEFIDDMEYRRKLFVERPFIKKMYGVEKAEDPGPVIFRIFKGEAYFWTSDYNIRESEIERINF